VSALKVDVHEMIAWGFDEYPLRNAMADFSPEALANRVRRACEAVAERECHLCGDALLVAQTESIQPLLTLASQRDDLQKEYEGLTWTLGVVDLRRLLAFQRRLIFDPTRQPLDPFRQDDWPGLISLAIGTRRSTGYRLVRNKCVPDGTDVSLYSSNPDLQLRLDSERGESELLPLSLYGGSPFLEVAELGGRWFLRDGYHRAYSLLQMGVHHVPAVVIYARDIGEVGATEPWFFCEEQLFSDRPPRVIDFLHADLVLKYKRVPLRKVIRVHIEESLEPLDEIESVQGDEL
jgi:hypothetical protein